MRRKATLDELIKENKLDLIEDEEELERITEKVIEKMSNEKSNKR